MNSYILGFIKASEHIVDISIISLECKYLAFVPKESSMNLNPISMSSILTRIVALVV